MPTLPVTADSVRDAFTIIHGVVDRTPLQLNPRLSERYSAEVYLKREDLQRTRSYKIRGAYHLIHSLSDAEKARGVICASAGNHAQGVAWSCSTLGIRGQIYMPQNTPRQKIERVRYFGGQWVDLVLTGDTYDGCYHVARQIATQTGMVFVHPFDDTRVIAGQGTVAIEIFEQLTPAPDLVLVPIGGGGLSAGLSTYSKAMSPSTQIIGVEPAGAAGMMASVLANHVVTLDEIDTFIDGAAVKTVGDIPFRICKSLLDHIVAVPEGQVCTEMIALYQNDGIIAEPAGALAVAALELKEIAGTLQGKRVVCIVSGGNNDISRYPEVLERSLIFRGLKHYFLVEFSQRAGSLRRYLDEVLGPDDDITLFEYIKKNNREFGPALVGIELTRQEDLQPLLSRMESIGLRYETISSDSALFRFLV